MTLCTYLLACLVMLHEHKCKHIHICVYAHIYIYACRYVERGRGERERVLQRSPGCLRGRGRAVWRKGK